MEIEQLLEHSDPAAWVDIPPPGSAQAQRIKAQALSPAVGPAHPTGVRSRRLVTPLAALGTVAVAVVLLLALLPAHLGQGGSDAAAALDRLALAAGRQAELGPGQYLYTEVKQGPTGVSGVGPAGSSESYTTYSVGTVQSWIAADGSGRQVTTTDLNPHFMTAADESAWKRSGGKFQEPPSYVVSDQEYGAGGTALNTNQVPGGPRTAPVNVAALPTDPTKLAKTLCGSQTWRKLPSTSAILGYSIASPPNTSRCDLFGIAVMLLQGPDIGSSPDLRQALFKVLATVPGVQLIGNRTDAAGRKGVELRMTDRQPAGTTKFTCVNATATPPTTRTVEHHHQAMATTYSVIVDPSSATLLSVERSFSPSRVRSASLIPCGGPQVPANEFSELIPNQSVLVSSGVVDSTQSVTKGTIESCAPGSIPTPPWNICQGNSNDGDR